MNYRFRYQILVILGMIISIMSLMLAWPGMAYADSPFSCVNPVRIMPLGDSITRGNPANPPIGYRRSLYEALDSASYNIDFVGSQMNGDSSGFDPDHEGHSAYPANFVAGDIYKGGFNWLGNNPADVILLHIGTNDIIDGQDVPGIVSEVEQILNKIDMFEADQGTTVPVILARIINQVPATTTVTTYNNALQTMADARITSGDNIIVVDMENALNYVDDMYNQYHPNEAGYSKMAAVWFNALAHVLPACNGTPVITSSPNTNGVKGLPYTYDVEAVSDTSITFSAPVKPNGMSINSSTGLINWTPSAVGAFPVTVHAINAVGTSTQTFTINVTNPVAPNIISTPQTTAVVNQIYVYDVNANGNPAPTYSLTVKPTGMSINSISGVIQWTPTTNGSFNVTVRATNSVGFNTQSFTIDVTNQLSCPTNLAAYWHLDETGGSTFVDSYDGHDATCTGTGGTCPTPTAGGKINGAQSFSYNNSTRVNVPAHTDFNWSKNDSFSIELWMKGNIKTCDLGGSEVLVGRDDHSSGLQWWLGCAKISGDVTFQLKDTSGDGMTLSGPAINDGGWHHIAAVRNGSNSTTYIYVDGTQVASGTHTYAAGFGSATQPLNIGWFDNRSGPGFYFDGTLDEIATYNQALSAPEVNFHYARGQNNLELCLVPEASEIKVYIPLVIKH